MGIGILFIGTWSFLLFATSLFIAQNANQFYPATLPFVVASGSIVALIFIASLLDRYRTFLYKVAITLQGMLFLPCYYALRLWPGGDDGPGLAWLLFIGGGSCIALILTVVLAVKGTAG